MTSDHQRQKRPKEDVVLSQGRGFLVGDVAYKKHLAEATVTKTVRCPIAKTSGTTSNILLLNSGILVMSTKQLVLPTAPVHEIWLVRRVQCVGMGIASPIAWSDLPKVKGESSQNRLIGHLVDNQADNVKWTMLLVK